MNQTDYDTSRAVLLRRLFATGHLPYRADMVYTDKELYFGLLNSWIKIIGADGILAARRLYELAQHDRPDAQT